MTIEPAALEALQALVLGFAFAGLLASTFEFVTETRASFHLLERGGATALASVPVLVFSAPFIILRNTLRGAGSSGGRCLSSCSPRSSRACGASPPGASSSTPPP
jgi:hypothetical protein